MVGEYSETAASYKLQANTGLKAERLKPKAKQIQLLAASYKP